ncbi:hypothetical protein LTR17_003607 [Elasticomyces elasticus]|nr:hypothetical protein LTR17_003607 [Elasticomyces elasticus]
MAADSLNEKADNSDVKTAEQQRRGSTSEGELETVLGYKPELERNRWVIILILDESVALSLGELASRYPTSGGPSYWTVYSLTSGYEQSFQVAPKYKVSLAYITGWIWLIGNWTITLSGPCYDIQPAMRDADAGQ